MARLDIFGSAARDYDLDLARSDADFLVTFSPDAETDFYLDFEETLERILGRKVDLLDRAALDASRNYLRRRSILEHAKPIYVA